MGDKQGSGWFPTRKSRSVCYSQGGPTYQVQQYVYPEGYAGSSEEESEDETSEAPRFVEGEVISDSAESDESSEEGEASENDDLTAEERLGGRTIG